VHRLIGSIVVLFCLAALGARADTLSPTIPAANSPTTTVMTKSPATAVLMSLACPGLGQYYNNAYWKIPIFTGTAAVSVWLFLDNNAKFNDANALYEAAAASGDVNAGRLLTVREVYRDNRDLSGLVFLVTYALAAVDAYVGAHLYDFDVDEDVSLGIGPTRTQLLALQLSVTFP